MKVRQRAPSRRKQYDNFADQDTGRRHDARRQLLNTASPANRLFYGWIVVAAAFAVTFVGFGSAYTFNAFLPSLQHDFGASRGSVSLVFSLAGFLYFGLGVVSGPLADRWSWAAILSAVVMDHFGGRNVGGIIGILYTSVAIGTLIGPSTAGFIFDMSHSYTLPILASVGANTIAAGVAALATKEPARVLAEKSSI